MFKLLCCLSAFRIFYGYHKVIFPPPFQIYSWPFECLLHHSKFLCQTILASCCFCHWSFGRFFTGCFCYLLFILFYFILLFFIAIVCRCYILLLCLLVFWSFGLKSLVQFPRVNGYVQLCLRSVVAPGVKGVWLNPNCCRDSPVLVLIAQKCDISLRIFSPRRTTWISYLRKRTGSSDLQIK